MYNVSNPNILLENSNCFISALSSHTSVITSNDGKAL